MVDERTGRRYSLKISEDGTVRSADLKQITAGGDGNGIKMFDPGCTNTATCRSTVSFIDGGKGVLRYRGIPIEALAEKSTYLETAYLLQYGHLPSRAQLASWEEAVMRHSALPACEEMITTEPRTMPALRSACETRRGPTAQMSI